MCRRAVSALLPTAGTAVVHTGGTPVPPSEAVSIHVFGLFTKQCVDRILPFLAVPLSRQEPHVEAGVAKYLADLVQVNFVRPPDRCDLNGRLANAEVRQLALMIALSLSNFPGLFEAGDVIFGLKGLYGGRWTKTVLREQETAPVIEEIDISAGVTAADRMKEDDPTVGLTFDLDVGVTQPLAIMCSQDDADPVRWMNEDR